jgi:hypothetical protein
LEHTELFKGLFMRISVVSSGLGIGLVALSAQARVQPYYVQVPISAAAVAADPALANYKTWDLRVAVSNTGSTPDRFNVADFETGLFSGNFYSPAGGADIPIVPQTANIPYDTYVTVPGYVPGGSLKIYIAGSGDLTGPGSPTPIFPRFGEQQRALNVVWGTLGNPMYNGDYQIARLTVSNDATGPIVGYVAANIDYTTPQFAASMKFFKGMLAADGGSFPMLADANHDNRVNSGDFSVVSQNFSQGNTSWEQGDFNGDGRINALDFNAISTNYGIDAQAPALGQTVVPEPASFAVLAMSMIIARRRRSALPRG